MLIQKPYIGVIGEGGYKWYNAASMDNNGVEATLTWSCLLYTSICNKQ